MENKVVYNFKFNIKPNRSFNGTPKEWRRGFKPFLCKAFNEVFYKIPASPSNCQFTIYINCLNRNTFSESIDAFLEDYEDYKFQIVLVEDLKDDDLEDEREDYSNKMSIVITYKDPVGVYQESIIDIDFAVLEESYYVFYDIRPASPKAHNKVLRGTCVVTNYVKNTNTIDIKGAIFVAGNKEIFDTVINDYNGIINRGSNDCEFIG